MFSPRMTARRLAALACAVGAAGSVAAAVAPAASAASVPVLGSSRFADPGKGFGTAHPASIDNGGDASGVATRLVWKRWGSAVAVGTGKTYAFKPGGGYYSRPVNIELHAQKLGRCTAGGPAAYTQLIAREQVRPDGPFGHYFLWAGAKSICTS